MLYYNKYLKDNLKFMNNFRPRDMAVVSMCVAVIACSAWITIPFTVNFTLQTLAIFVISSVFDFKKSFLSILLYILIGVCGLPVFSGFGAGPATVFGPTGGYLAGFMLIPPIMLLFSKISKASKALKFTSMLVSLFVCYLFGTLWYYIGFGAQADITFAQILTLCVIPFIIPDILKILIALSISERLSQIKF